MQGSIYRVNIGLLVAFIIQGLQKDPGSLWYSECQIYISASLVSWKASMDVKSSMWSHQQSFILKTHAPTIGQVLWIIRRQDSNIIWMQPWVCKLRLQVSELQCQIQ